MHVEKTINASFLDVKIIFHNPVVYDVGKPKASKIAAISQRLDNT